FAEVDLVIDEVQRVADRQVVVDRPFESVKASTLRDQTRMTIDDPCGLAELRIDQAGTAHEKEFEVAPKRPPIFNRQDIKAEPIRERGRCGTRELGRPMLKEHVARRTALEGGDDKCEVEAIAPDESKQHVLRFLMWNVVGDERDPRPPLREISVTILVRCGSHGSPQFQSRSTAWT